MNIINIEHISKLFGDKLIFDDASFGLQEVLFTIMLQSRWMRKFSMHL